MLGACIGAAADVARACHQGSFARAGDRLAAASAHRQIQRFFFLSSRKEALNHELAFAKYHERLGGFIAAKQKAAVKFTSFFAPRSRFGMFLGNQVTKLMALPLVSELAVAREVRDAIELPDY